MLLLLAFSLCSSSFGLKGSVWASFSHSTAFNFHLFAVWSPDFVCNTDVNLSKVNEQFNLCSRNGHIRETIESPEVGDSRDLPSFYIYLFVIVLSRWPVACFPFHVPCFVPLVEPSAHVVWSISVRRRVFRTTASFSDGCPPPPTEPKPSISLLAPVKSTWNSLRLVSLCPCNHSPSPSVET